MSIPNFIDRKSVENEKYWIAREFFLNPGVLRASSHGFRAGGIDDYYFDMDLLLNDPYQCKIIIEIYAALISECVKDYPIDFISFIEKASGGTVGAIRLAAALSIETGYENVIVRPGKTISFEQVKISREGQGKDEIKEGFQGRSTLIITDHCTSGREARIAADILKENNAVIKDVITYSVRMDKFDEGVHSNKTKYESDNLELHYKYELPIPEKRPRTHTELDNIAISL